MLPQAAPLPAQETPRRFLTHLARMQHAADPESCVTEVLTMIGLENRSEIRMRALSEGERKLVAIGQAFLGAPQVVLLDEPTSALDPWGRQRLRTLVRARRDAGGAVVLASHNLGEAEQLCDEAMVLADGRVQTVAALSSLLHAPDEVRFEIGHCGTLPIDQIRTAVEGITAEFDAQIRVVTVRGIASPAQMERVVGTSLRLLSEAGADVRRVVCGRSLEWALTAMVGLDRGAPPVRTESLRS
jgi:ABC-type multidrug transport system ATPase subunit